VEEDIPTCVEDNTAGLAILDLFKKTDSHTGVILEVTKKMNVGSGLGSSGACASACVYGLNKLLNTNLSTNEMIEIASRGEVASGNVAHADNVAGALLGGFVVLRNSHPINVIKVDVPDIPIVVGVVKKSQRTTRPMIPASIPLETVKEQLSYCARVVHAILTRDLEEFGTAINVDHISEPIRSKSIPGYYDIKKRLLESGAYGCNICGGGSSIFAVCKQTHVHDVAAVLKEELEKRELKNEIIVTKASNKGAQELPSSKKEEL
jgi:homoserine kinase